MTIEGHQSMGIDLSPGAFMDICLAEKDRRLARHDSCLIRPKFMPRLVRTARPFVGKGRGTGAYGSQALDEGFVDLSGSGPSVTSLPSARYNPVAISEGGCDQKYFLDTSSY
ncbi:MAG: hypothetical protein QNJ94_16315 [Alphaproteobacteria bacterium]|nr:hypothetical protein [Alphaproteobacteria bacterium]